MYLIYVDDSGKPELSNRDSYFCLRGIIINEYDWKDIDNSINNSRLKLFSNGLTYGDVKTTFKHDRMDSLGNFIISG